MLSLWDCDLWREELEDWPMTREDRIFSEFIFLKASRETGAQRSIGKRIVSYSSKPLKAVHEMSV